MDEIVAGQIVRFIVTKVWSPTTVNLMVFPNDGSTLPYQRTSVQCEDVLPAYHPPYSWHLPERA